MQRKFVYLILASFLLFFLFLKVKDIKASEGTVELRSTNNQPYKCYVSSLRMQNLEYRMPFSCKNLIYPADENIFIYIMWANPTSGGKSFKLGALGLGRGEFKTKTSFSSLFVTTEKTKDVKTPSQNIVMRGDVQPIKFLQETATPTPSPSQAPSEETEEQEEIQSTPSPTPTPVVELTAKQKLGLALKRAGIAALFALVALIGLIFVVTRSRG